MLIKALFFQTPDKYYLVMKLSKGSDLAGRIVTRLHFSEEEAIKILRMLLEGVRFVAAYFINSISTFFKT